MEALDYLRFLAALAATLGLLLIAAWALRKYGHRLGGFALSGIQAQAKRLTVVETLALGPRQRLTLIRCDQTEHLLIVSPDGARVVKSGIAGTPSE